MQNGNGFLRPEEERYLTLFRDAAAMWQVYDMDALKERLLYALAAGDLPEDLSHQAKNWGALKGNFLKHWDYMIEITSRMPKQAMTQGVGSAISRAPFQLLTADGIRKSVAVAQAFDGDVTSHATCSALQLAPFSAIVLDRAAASRLTNKGQYFQVELPVELGGMFSDDSLTAAFIQRAIRDEQLTNWQIAAILNEPLSSVKKMNPN